MTTELRIPEVGESITEVEIGAWLKQEGDAVEKDENVVSLESEKATIELPAPAAGVLAGILKQKGEMAAVGEVIGYLEDGSATKEKAGGKTPAPPLSARVAHNEVVEEKKFVMPAAERALQEKGLKAEEVKALGPGGRLLKEDVLNHGMTGETKPVEAAAPKSKKSEGSREEEVVPMTMLRRTVAKHLVEAQHSMAMLTTFNEIDMSAVIALRKEFQEKFLEKYGTKPGFMSFFVKAVVDA